MYLLEPQCQNYIFLYIHFPLYLKQNIQIEEPVFSDTNKKLLDCVWRLLLSQEGNYSRNLIPLLSINSCDGRNFI